jgi:hypothetical protein
MTESHTQRGDVDASFEHKAHLICVSPVWRIHHAVRARADDLSDILGRDNASFQHAAQITCIAAHFLIRIDLHPHQIQVRMLDDRAQ